MSEHTPTPWLFSPWHIEEGPSAVRSADGWVICTTASDADAAYIVRCVNLFDKLVAALEPFAKEADNWLDSIHDDYRPLCVEPNAHDADGGGYAHPGSETFFTLGDLRRARAVIAKAKESV